MKTAVIFIGIVIISFLAIFMLFNQSTKPNEATNFLTPTPTPNPLSNNPATQGTPVPTATENEKVTANKAIIKTAKGNIEVELYPQDAPKTVTNFATLSSNGYYDGLTFHRVEDWVIQGGDPSGNGTGGTSIYGETFEDELNPNTQSYQTGYVEGVLAMANRGPNTNGSQFFILKKDYPLDHAYTIFGKVTAGMDVVQNIEQGDVIQTIEVQ